MRSVIAYVVVLLAVVAGSAAAQSRGTCAGQLDPLINRKLTISGLVLNVTEVERFISVILFRDVQSGCEFTAMEGLLDDTCKPGRSIAITGVLKRSTTTKGYEIDRGNDPSDDTLACR
jgi:hypothetical protein